MRWPWERPELALSSVPLFRLPERFLSEISVRWLGRSFLGRLFDFEIALADRKITGLSKPPPAAFAEGKVRRSALLRSSS